MIFTVKYHLIMKTRSGITLIEMLIVIGLLSGLMLTLVTLFTTTLDTQLQSQSYSSLQGNGRFIMARLDYDIARSTAVRTPAALGSTATSLVLTIGGVSFTYKIIGSDLNLTDNIGNALLNSNDVKVSNLSFKRIGFSGDKPTVSYSFTLTSTTKANGTYDTQVFSGTMGQR